MTLDKIIDFLKKEHAHVLEYLPDAKEIHKVAKEWICNVIATILKEEFTDWMKDKVEERNELVVDKREMNIEMDPDVAAAFRASTAVSCKYGKFVIHDYFIYLVSKGQGVNLLKVGVKRKRTKAQIEEDERQELEEREKQ